LDAINAKTVKGLTLIELLITIVILSMVIGLASYSFSLFSSHWSTSRDSFARASGAFQRVELVRTAVENGIAWAVRDRKSGDIGFYFLGREEGFTLVSNDPVFSVGAPAVIRVFREPDGPGRWKLVYEEASLRTVSLRHPDQTLPFSHRMVVIEGLRQLSFRYFGWPSLRIRSGGFEEFGEQAVPDWFDTFDGLQRVQHPQLVGMTLDGIEVPLYLPERSDRILDAMLTE
jgi:prepilin-type N-terminal cleavage/methylation domain-containing protein